MIYKNLNDCVKDLESRGQLIRIKEEINPNLEIAEIHRRVYEQKGPALLFEKIKGSPFKGLSNLFGTIERSEYIFQDVLKKFEFLIKLKIDPTFALRNPGKTLMNLPSMLSSIPKKTWNNSIVNQTCKISQLPQIKSWQDDGGAFVTLPQVISFPPGSKKLKDANVGMYRIQLSGNEYEMDKEVGLHYQLHRGIGIHHKMYNESDNEFKISIGIGGPPSNTLASIFPLPEGLSEIIFSGILGQRAYRYNWQNGYFIPSEADFVITGKINKSKLKPEGPFGDHLGYYSLTHDFPVMEVDKIFHRKDAIWHFTVVGRPPQEDSSFGHLIHELVKSLTTHELPGIKEVHAVDAAGVHPLLLAIGSERYMPFRERKPEEILTQANLLLGKGQTSLAKFLFIAADEENSSLNLKNTPEFIIYCLERADFTKDLHFQTKTTIDTLDYSGSGWNSGSKLVLAVNREKQRELSIDRILLEKLLDLGFPAKYIDKGILAVKYSSFTTYINAETEIENLCKKLEQLDLKNIALITICDDVEFMSKNWDNFLWATFTRTNPSHDIYGVGSYTMHKHWASTGPLVFDARSKPHHAPPLLVSDELNKKVDQFIERSAELQQVFSS